MATLTLTNQISYEANNKKNYSHKKILIHFKTLNQLKASRVNGSLGQNYFHRNTKM